jgi:HEAT repeat
MERRRGISLWILAGVLAVVAAGLVLGHFLPSREPVYEGKRLTEWLEQCNASFLQGERRPVQFEQAQAAIRAIGTNGLPICLKIIRTKESPLVVKFLKLVPGSWLDRLHVPQGQDYHWKILQRQSWGAFGIKVLGAKASPAVPALIGLLKDKDLQTRQLAAYALGAIGPAAREAVPDLIKYIENPKEQVRIQAVLSLGEIHQEPERVVPLLLKIVDQDRASGWSLDLGVWAAQSLGKFGAQARPAVPALAEMLHAPEEFSRAQATNALGQIDPEALAKAQAGGK